MIEAFKSLTSTILPLDRADVDTDQIIPAEYLKRIERSGFGQFLFKGLRDDDPNFVLNDPVYSDAQILVAGRNFGCGSSREHAPWAIEDHGIRAIIAPSFADIFRNNCVNAGVVCVVLDEEAVGRLIEIGIADHTAEITVDLDAQQVRAGDDTYPFDIDEHHRYRLLRGLDHISLTLEKSDHIDEYERAH